MATDESARLHLLERARSALDHAAADTLMTALPWDPDRLATKDDLAALRTELRGDFQELRGEFHDLRGEVRTVAAQNLRTMVMAMVATNATLAGLVLAAVQLA